MPILFVQFALLLVAVPTHCHPATNELFLAFDAGVLPYFPFQLA